MQHDARLPHPTLTSPYAHELHRPPTVHGPLDGLRFAVKDAYAVAGIPTGLGNPTWAATHPAAPSHSADAVQRLLDAGASLVGIAHMDELAYGLTGRNIHYGTPLNPSAPGRVPGGSSSGSAAAVAAGHVDFALGSDTGGSVRVPAAFCGIHGVRPTHGRVSTRGLVPLAASFDTAGWFARDPSVLLRVGRVLLDAAPADPTVALPRVDERPGAPTPVHDEAPITCLVICEDLLALADPPVQRAFEQALSTLDLPQRRGTFGADLAAWGQAFRTVQGDEIQRTHGAWVQEALRRDPAAFAPDVAARLAWCASLTDAEIAHARDVRAAARAHFLAQVKGGIALCFPTTPSVALPLDFDATAMDAVRERIMRLTCPAGLAGAPQITLPLTTEDGLPCGLSVAAAPGADEALLELVRQRGQPG